VRTVAHVAGVERPGHFELRDVAAVDLGERRVARPARVAARVRPLLGDGGRRHEEDERERLGDSGQGAPARAAILAWLSREGVWPRLVQTLGRKQASYSPDEPATSRARGGIPRCPRSWPTPATP